MTAPPGRSLRLPLVLAGAAAFSTSTLFSAMKPMLITRLVEQAGYATDLAGLAAAMPFVGGVVSSFLLPWTARRIDAGVAAGASAVGLALAELGNAIWVGQAGPLLAGQLAAGLFGGMLMGLVSQSIAIAPRSEENFGIVDMAGVLMMSGMIAMLGAAVERNGLRGGFLTAAGLCALFAVILLLSRRGLIGRGALDDADGRAPFAFHRRHAAVLAMGVIFVTFSGLGFAFMVTAARAVGFSYQAAGSAIGVVRFLSAAGCLAGGWCAARFRPDYPLLAAFAACALGWHAALHAGSRAVFLAALLPATFSLQFCFPMLLALAGRSDPGGRLAAVAAPVIVSGFAWAAILAGLVVERWGVGALSGATAAGMILCALLIRPSTRGPQSPGETGVGIDPALALQRR